MMGWLREKATGERVLGLLAVVVVLVWLAQAQLPDGRLHVYFLDVGQGDAILVRAPDGRQVLVDGGPSPAALLNELGQVMPYWDHSLDLVVLTHPDQDHMAGLIPLVGRYQVGQVLANAQTGTAPEAAVWRESLLTNHVQMTPASPGLKVSLGGPSLTVLHSSLQATSGLPDNGNNDSVVLRLDYGQTSFLLTGDAEQEAEAQMLSQGALLQADVLKVGHHGSDRSTSAAFLAAVAPRLAVIQVGANNRFGHPQPAVLERLRDIALLRTDRDGRIEVISDGTRLWVKRSK
jgi:competence protein ComEC